MRSLINVPPVRTHRRQDRRRYLTLLLALFPPTTAAATLPGFAVLSDDPGSWPQILSSVGFESKPAALSGILVLRPGATASPEWVERVEGGAFLVMEGQSAVAEMFGFRPTAEHVVVGSLIDSRRPKLPIIWQKPLELPRFEVPRQAHIFAWERWTGAPVLAGFHRGKGAVLWVAVSPGEHGYERFPYILHALADLGLEPPFRSARLWAFFDYSYRTRVDLDYFAARWRAAGIAALHVAAWQFYDPDAERDAYLRKLIEACHREGVLVYAWLELPHVSERFWNEHPQWREKTAVLQDAQLDWRKLMNLTNRDCFRAVSAGVRNLIGNFDWDGVNLAEVYFESLEGAGNPARFTPMNDDVRREFRELKGFDPVDLFHGRSDAASLRAFLDFRAELARRMQEEWIGEIEKARHGRPNLDLVLTHVDDRFDTGMKDAIGADASRVLPLLKTHDFTFLIEDPATIWNLGPQRYPEIAKRYQPLTPRTDKLAIDINVVDRYQNVYPTKQQTGTELFQLVHLASGSFARVALYFENSILPPDLPLLSAAGAVVNRIESIGPKLVIDAPHPVGVPWSGAAKVDGTLWPVGDGSVIWVPSGVHSLEPAAASPAARVLALNGDLKSARSLAANRIELSYESPSRGFATLNRKPLRLEVDGGQVRPDFLASARGWTLALPRGQHLATIETE